MKSVNKAAKTGKLKSATTKSVASPGKVVVRKSSVRKSSAQVTASGAVTGKYTDSEKPVSRNLELANKHMVRALTIIRESQGTRGQGARSKKQRDA